MSQVEIEIAVLALVVVALAALIVWIAVRRRTTPEKREQRRRLQIQAAGRLGDAVVTEAEENLLYYSYSIRGVHYTASQDVSSLRERLPEELGRVVGPATMKYTPANPANSILVCEEWCGVRLPTGFTPAPAPRESEDSANRDVVRHPAQDAASRPAASH